MKVLLTGILGFAGRSIAELLLASIEEISIYGIDNLSRSGSELNLNFIKDYNIKFSRGDIRCSSDVDSLPQVDWVIDCAANPSVLAGLNGQSSSRQLMEHNLQGTINILEYCKKYKSGLILLSTSRVYSATILANLPVDSSINRFELQENDLRGLSQDGLSEDFPTNAPISLYGASKLASETLILEYGECFDFPVWINRCGVLAGAGQFGKADQGIFSYWIHSFREKNPLKYIGFNGTGHQVRDAMHPKDLVPLLYRQIMDPEWEAPKILNIGGGRENSMSLKELSIWCEDRFGQNEVISSKADRPMDAPWIIMDSTTAQNAWNWKIKTELQEILNEIADYAEKNPSWLSLTT